MNRKLTSALLLIAGLVIVLLKTKGHTSVNLLIDTVSLSTSMALLAAAAVGVAIGLLLK